MSTMTEDPSTITAEPDTDLEDAFRSIVENEDSPQDDDSDGDHERFSHYASKEDIARSAMTRTPIIALCGKKWTPRRNPEAFPVCPDCKDAYEKLKDE